ncbi:Aminodeoxychorismate synthase component 2 [Rosistilla carotiformis]|uniref:Aminodeoxychorismate synthase component 2 n=1 Tax=Rosistilla carotiformis TaxID=2528017 RepID=A0A518JVJ9_9BACT|nr:aminodeoxychorismate/anthranilate synthase component II [Rosistilla carotiformis]QDV69558.1 Aminodeoxychorismate synthase component 2 [Rosistilla carotiformis]
MLLVLDNYDSFVHNLARYLRRHGHRTLVVRSDQIGIEDVRRIGPTGLILSPGPQAPDQAGACVEITRAFAGQLPILGVCLGHQIIAQAFGGRIVRAHPMHGVPSMIEHGGDGLFAGLPSPFAAGRYHSLVADAAAIPDVLQVTAWTDDRGAAPDAPEVGDCSDAAVRLVMGIRHREFPIFGVQFHPESILTDQGDALLKNFLRHLPTESPTACS